MQNKGKICPKASDEEERSPSQYKMKCLIMSIIFVGFVRQDDSEAQVEVHVQ